MSRQDEARILGRSEAIRPCPCPCPCGSGYYIPRPIRQRSPSRYARYWWGQTYRVEASASLRMCPNGREFSMLTTLPPSRNAAIISSPYYGKKDLPMNTGGRFLKSGSQDTIPPSADGKQGMMIDFTALVWMLSKCIGLASVNNEPKLIEMIQLEGQHAGEWHEKNYRTPKWGCTHSCKRFSTLQP